MNTIKKKRFLIFSFTSVIFLLVFTSNVAAAASESPPHDLLKMASSAAHHQGQKLRRRRVAALVPPLSRWFSNNKHSAIKTTNASDTSSSCYSELEPKPHNQPNLNTYNPLRFYFNCMIIVAIWMACGTLFYSYCNDWPIPQSFFYAVDAGMSIGFCTEVAETKLISKAFTIIYILLGASVIGGALALFIQDAMEGIATSPNMTREYQVLLEKEVFEKANISRTGVLDFDEFESLIRESCKGDNDEGYGGCNISQDDIQQLWSKFDHLKDGVIHLEEFAGTYRGIDRLVKSLQKQNQNRIHQILSRLRLLVQQAWELEHRIYFVFAIWIAIGIIWGMVDQKWDPITATHFAVSALATGGLTAPHVNADTGTLPAEPAIFCGIYCLFGIPLFALTLGHYARVLVAGQVAAIESSAITRPLSPVEFDLAKHLTTPRDSVVHLSDFIVLQLLRQGKLSMDTIQLMKRNFDQLDTDRSGTLTLQQATTIAQETHTSS